MSNMSPVPEREASHERRIFILRLLFILIFLVYTVRLFSMQILNGEFYLVRARNIARRTAIIPAQRGEIYDRSFKTPLVLNTDSFAVSLTPGEVIPRERIPEVIARLAEILEIDRDQIDRKVPSAMYSLYQTVEVAVNVSFSTIATLAENRDSLPGVSWQSKPMRNYVDVGSLSHVIGYVGDITRDELTMLYNKGYQQGDLIGKNGIERQYDEILRGREGRETRTVDVRGRQVLGDDNTRTPPAMGKNLVLTIDRNIQTLAEKALGERMGAAVVMRPSNGEILAMVSYPWYDSNIFNRSPGGEYQTLINDPNKPFLNRAIQSSYPPASTFKIVMTTGILAENSCPREQLVDCQGEMTYGGRLWRCHIRRPGHGRLSLQMAMAHSCDIYYWNVGRDYLGVERIVSYARDYGLGEPTGVDLPGEDSGFIPTPQWKDRRLHERWLGGDTMNMSIGQGYTLVTPLQLANMVSMVVNDGVIYEPHVLKEVRDPQTGAVERNVLPKVMHKTDIDPNIYRTVRRDMRTVVTSGSARYPMNFKTVEVAGKTGTGEVGLNDKWHAWFVAFAPYETENPEERVVVSIIVEAANEWEWWAIYASAIILQGIYANQSYDQAVASLGFQRLMPVQGRRE